MTVGRTYCKNAKFQTAPDVKKILFLIFAKLPPSLRLRGIIINFDKLMYLNTDFEDTSRA